MGSKMTNFIAGFLLVVTTCLLLNYATGQAVQRLGNTDRNEPPIVPILTDYERKILCN